MYLQMAAHMIRSVDPRILANFQWNFGLKGVLAVQRFKARLKRGVHFPPFLYLSIVNSCNLRCQGCWIDVDKPQVKLELDELDRIVNEAKDHGNSFFGILGGEPFLHPELFDFLAQHPDCFFQIFTNGQLITEKSARLLRRLANATPLISIEGSELVSDDRRGNKDVYERSMRGLRHCLDEKLITGVATSLCQSNIDDLLSEKWLRRLVDLGVHYAWYHTYRAVGPVMRDDLALRADQAQRVREFVVNMRCRMPIGIVDAYYDGEGRAVCPMVTGFSHHIGPTGGVEPCPIIQFAAENVRDHPSIFEAITKSEFLRDFRRVSAQHTRGCILVERPDLVKLLAEKHGAKDTTLRQTAMQELEAMRPKASQYLPGQEIPEKSVLYRVVKRMFYHDFGAYAPFRAAEADGARDTAPELQPETGDSTEGHKGNKEVCRELDGR